MNNKSRHFADKDAAEHLKDAREKGHHTFAEPHGLEPMGWKNAFLDGLQISAIILSLLLLVHSSSNLPTILIITFSFGMVIFLFARSAFFGWSRLEKLHTLIKEENWEITHHREQEKKELIAIYRAKGFQGEILTQIVDTLAADDNRLLEVMLTEELGIPLESYDHPLQQGCAAATGCFISCTAIYIASRIHPLFGTLIVSGIIIGVSSFWFAKIQKNNRLHAVIWSIALFGLIMGSTYFLLQHLHLFL
ncbi:MAG: VIT1/CCC1 transporter family protein [Chlamydiales bacterium]